MKINNKNLPILIKENLHKERFYGAGLWNSDGYVLIEKDIDDIIYFYKNSFSRGLLERPTKTAPLTPYHTKEFYIGWFVKEYLWSKVVTRRKKILCKKEFKLFKESGLIFPKYNEVHSDFYYLFDGESFNKNLSKFASSTSYIKQHTKHEKIKNICEIGGGYGGMCEMMILNNDINTYIIIDIFATLSVAMTYLTQCSELKDYEKVYCERFEDLQNDRKKIVFINANYYQDFIGRYPQIDLFINSNSFAEMSLDTVNDYFSFIQNFNDTYLFSSNAVKPLGKKIICSKDFPYDQRWKNLYQTQAGSDLRIISKR